MLRIYKWFTSSRLLPGGAPAPVEAIVLRCFGVAWLALCLVGTFTTRPYPGLHGRGAVILAATIGLVAAALSTQPQRLDKSSPHLIAALMAVTAAAAVLAAVQPNGIWASGPVFVGIIAALRLERRPAVLILAVSLSVPIAVSLIGNRGAGSLGALMTAVPWFLVMRLLRQLREQRDALHASRAAEARAAAAAERGRLAREMHDVLAHSLSALALQLESTRPMRGWPWPRRR